MSDKARIHEIADALAHHLGGTHVPANRDGEFVDWYACVEVPMPAPSLPYTLSLTRKGYGAKAGAITATLYPADYPGERISPRISWPRATVGGNRDNAAIVADIARRVCNTPAAAAALTAHAAALADRDTAAAGVDGAMSRILTGTNARENQNSPRTSSSGNISSNPGGVYYSARISPSSVYFDRIGSVSVDQAILIIAVLEGKA